MSDEAAAPAAKRVKEDSSVKSMPAADAMFVALSPLRRVAVETFKGHLQSLLSICDESGGDLDSLPSRKGKRCSFLLMLWLK